MSERSSYRYDTSDEDPPEMLFKSTPVTRAPNYRSINLEYFEAEKHPLTLNFCSAVRSIGATVKEVDPSIVQTWFRVMSNVSQKRRRYLFS